MGQMKRKMLYIIVFAVSGHDGGSDEEKDVIYIIVFAVSGHDGGGGGGR